MICFEQDEPGYYGNDEECASRHPHVREKVLKKGVGAAADHELVMLLLGSGSKTQPVSRLARKVLTALAASNPENRIEALMNVKGMGPGKTLIIAAAIELGRRLNAYTLAPIKKPQDIVPFVQHYAMQPNEHFISVTLNGAHEILQIRAVTSGTVNKTLIHPREIFFDAVKERACAIIVCHNHPSGSCLPSEEDIETTRRIYQASKVLGIHILDHLIITRTGFYSFRAQSNVFNDTDITA
ncbi:MAG: DNA repair protein RadC [Treponemataceae bacterium]|nr:MAG: DNA repair protein RadC [Treponemataceae bacterium]